ncbi:MAG: AP2 domain-containing protein [Akkermansiaceae bacterium]
MKQDLKRFPGLYHEPNIQGASRFRILINHNKKIIQEYFYYGAGKTEAVAKKEALKRWREIRKKVPVLTKRRFREVLRKPTASGIPGVTRITTYSKGHEYEVWKASWTTRSGTRRSRQFSINKYGTRKAKRLAIEARLAALDKIAPK